MSSLAEEAAHGKCNACGMLDLVMAVHLGLGDYHECGRFGRTDMLAHVNSAHPGIKQN